MEIILTAEYKFRFLFDVIEPVYYADIIKLREWIEVSFIFKRNTKLNT